MNCKPDLRPQIANSLMSILLMFSVFFSINSLESAVAQVVSQTPIPVQQPTVPIFIDGEAQIVEGFRNSKEWIRHDLWVQTEFDSDNNGTNDRVHVSVTRQKQTQTEGLKVPVVYNTSPYFSGTGSTKPQFMWDPKHESGTTPPQRNIAPPIPQQSRRPTISSAHTRQWVPRGYAVVHSCSPGTGLSQGCPTIGGDNESLAPKAVIDWLCGRGKGYTTPDGNEEVHATWCTGKIGMTGTSFEGTLPIAAATTGVEGLEAIIPVAANTSYYHYYRSNGLVRHPGGYMGEDVDVLFDFVHSGNAAMRDHCCGSVRDQEMAQGQDRESGDYNEFWAGRDYLNDLGPYKAATLMAHGLNDWNVMPSHTVRIHEALKKKGVPLQLYLHQGGHGGPPTVKLMNRWFTRYLFGIENGVEKDPKSWIVREADRRGEPTAYQDYPNPAAEAVKLHLTSGGKAAGGLSLSPVADQAAEKLTDDVGIGGRALAKAPVSDNRLIYATPALHQAVHLSGTSRIKIRLASSKPAANLSIWMVSLPWNGEARKLNDNLITRGWADPQNHRSLTKSEPLEPGKFYDLEFDLEPDDQIIPVGQQIGLMIFSSDRDFTLWPEPGTELTIDIGATSIEIPVVGGSKAFAAASGK